MLVCHCNGVSDRTIRRVVREGALTVGEVGQACGAGTCCQGCNVTIGRIIRHESQREAKSPAPVARPAASTAP